MTSDLHLLFTDLLSVKTLYRYETGVPTATTRHPVRRSIYGYEIYLFQTKVIRRKPVFVKRLFSKHYKYKMKWQGNCVISSSSHLFILFLSSHLRFLPLSPSYFTLLLLPASFPPFCSSSLICAFFFLLSSPPSPLLQCSDLHNCAFRNWEDY